MTDETERDAQLKQLEHLKAMGEKAYDDMYETRSATASYSDAKECYYDAIGLARQLGLNEEVEALEKRLAHIKAVFRGQFT
jgi:hypothetical protein